MDLSLHWSIGYLSHSCDVSRDKSYSRNGWCLSVKRCRWRVSQLHYLCPMLMWFYMSLCIESCIILFCYKLCSLSVLSSDTSNYWWLLLEVCSEPVGIQQQTVNRSWLIQHHIDERELLLLHQELPRVAQVRGRNQSERRKSERYFGLGEEADGQGGVVGIRDYDGWDGWPNSAVTRHKWCLLDRAWGVRNLSLLMKDKKTKNS